MPGKKQTTTYVLQCQDADLNNVKQKLEKCPRLVECNNRKNESLKKKKKKPQRLIVRLKKFVDYQTKDRWGRRYIISNPEPTMTYYYLSTKPPCHTQIEDVRVEFGDYENIIFAASNVYRENALADEEEKDEEAEEEEEEGEQEEDEGESVSQDDEIFELKDELKKMKQKYNALEKKHEEMRRKKDNEIKSLKDKLKRREAKIVKFEGNEPMAKRRSELDEDRVNKMEIENEDDDNEQEQAEMANVEWVAEGRNRRQPPIKVPTPIKKIILQYKPKPGEAHPQHHPYRVEPVNTAMESSS